MNYFIVDTQSDYKSFADIKDIRNLLIDVLFHYWMFLND